MVKICGIYKITSPSNKIYIGKSVHIYKRWRFYKGIHCKEQPRLYKSLLKYGILSHKFEIIDVCLPEELNVKERYYQDLFQCTGKSGMNCMLTNPEREYFEVKDTTKEKIKNALVGKKRPLDVVNKIIESKRKNPYVYTEDIRRKMSESGKKRPPMSEETRKKISEISRRPQSEETKKKISMAHKGKKMSKEFAEAVGNRTRGRKATLETRKKLSASLLGRVVSEETRKKISRGHMGKKMSESARLKMSLNNGASVIVLDTESGIFYNTIKLAAESKSLNVNRLRRMISGETKNKTQFIRA